MRMKKRALEAMCIVAILSGVVPLGTSNTAMAQSVTAPKNLRVTGVTDWTVALQWDAPKGKVPSAYVVQSSTGHSMTVMIEPLAIAEERISRTSYGPISAIRRLG